jgi:predicted glycoside hydrolase/deacetylase ChbG (UPF0249 family)
MKGIIISLLIALSLSAKASQPMIEKLGFNKSDKVLIIHADDLGISHETNRGIEQTLKAGAVTSASIIVPGHRSKLAMEELKQWDLGLHLALNSEWKGYRWAPTSDWQDVSSMVEDYEVPEPFTGRMIRPLHRSGGGSVANATTAHIEKEIRAQIQQSLDWGLRPTHIDTHMGTVLAKVEWAQAYLRAARDFKLPMMLPRPSKHLINQIGEEQVKMLTPLLKKVDEWGFFTLDYLILGAQGMTFDSRKASYMHLIRTLKPGITQLIVHPSLDFEGYLSEKWQIRRLLDVKILEDKEFLQLLKDEGIKLTTWGAINKHYDWAKIPEVLKF